MQVPFYGHVRQYHNLKAEIDAIVDKFPVRLVSLSIARPRLEQAPQAVAPKEQPREAIDPVCRMKVAVAGARWAAAESTVAAITSANARLTAVSRDACGLSMMSDSTSELDADAGPHRLDGEIGAAEIQ